LTMRHTCPKKVRIVILGDGQGSTRFQLAGEYRQRAQGERSKGFAPIAWLNIPLRRLHPSDGCSRYYRYFVTRALSPKKENPMNLMQQAVLDILRRYDLDKAFNTAAELHIRVENPPYMPLVIERQGGIVSVAHYSELNGDLIRDPECTFRWPDWVPTSITQDPVGRYEEVFSEGDGQMRVRVGLLRDLKLFANMWARNLMAQGFGNPGLAVSSLTHPIPPGRG
jgi:hypothetical protein